MEGKQQLQKHTSTNVNDTFGDICLTAMENSSAHGLPNVYRNKSSTLRVIWAVLFLGGVLFVTVEISKLVSTYLERNVSVNIDVKFERDIRFPAVTICNTNPVLLSRMLEMSESFQERFDSGNRVEETQTENAGEIPTTTSSSGNTWSWDLFEETWIDEYRASTYLPQTTTDEAILSWDDKESHDFFKTKSDEYTKRQLLITMLANMTVEDRMDLGHQLDNMLLSCEWKGYPCSPQNFTSFFHYKYGNCYTFNSQMYGNEDQVTTNMPGPLYGLSLELYAEQAEYMDGMTQTAGFKIVIHNPYEMPFPEDEGISISPGYETSIGIRVSEIHRLPFPYSDKCVSSIPDNSDDFYQDTYGVAYKMKTCERSCYQRAVMTQCDCADPKFPYPQNSTVNICSLTGDIADIEQIECTTSVNQRYRAGDLGCEEQCPLACYDRSHTTTLSSNIWPSDAYEQTLFQRMLSSNAEMRKQVRGDQPSEWTRKNVAKVLIYFQEFNYESIRQSPSYSETDLASDIGGQLGLWIGVSILTICELVQYLGVIVIFLIRKMFHCDNRIKDTTLIQVKAQQPPEFNNGGRYEQALEDLPTYSPPPSYVHFR